MKNLIIILAILICVCSYNSYSQTMVRKPKPNPKAFIDSLKLSTEYADYCYWKYKKEKKTGWYLFGLGGALAILSGFKQLNGEESLRNKYKQDLLHTNSNELKTSISNTYDLDIRKLKSINAVLLASGGIAAFSGIVLIIDSHKWKERVFISETGIGLRFYLSK